MFHIQTQNIQISTSLYIFLLLIKKKLPYRLFVSKVSKEFEMLLKGEREKEILYIQYQILKVSFQNNRIDENSLRSLLVVLKILSNNGSWLYPSTSIFFHFIILSTKMYNHLFWTLIVFIIQCIKIIENKVFFGTFIWYFSILYLIYNRYCLLRNPSTLTWNIIKTAEFQCIRF